MNSLTNPIIRVWKWWSTPRSSDPAVMYRERALRILLPIIILLRSLGIQRNYSGTPDLPAPYAPLWVSLAIFIVPILLSIYFLARQKVGWAGFFFILHWNLTDLLSLPAEGYWYPGYQISIIIQGVLGTLLLPSRAIIPFLIFQLTTIGMWGNWLDLNYYDPPLLSSGQPVAVFRRTIFTLAAQESIILFVVRYLRLQMEKSLRLQQSTIGQLQTEVIERHHVEQRLRSIVENSPSFILELDRNGIVKFANTQTELLLGMDIYQFTLPETREHIKNAVASVFETGQNVETEARVISTSGIVRWNAIRLGPLYSGDKVTGVIATLDNINERKEAELQAKQRAEQLATIVEIGHAVSTLQDLDSVLEIIYQQVQRIAPVDAFFICLLGEDKKQLYFPITYDMGIRYDETGIQLRPESRIGQVMLAGTPYRIHRTPDQVVEIEKDGDKGGVGNAKRKSGSLLFLPLRDSREVFGVLSIQSYALNAYPDELVETLSGIADQAAIAIQNARLFTNVQQELSERKQAEQQIQQRLQELAAIHAVSRAATSELELDVLFDLISNELFKLFDIQEIYFALHNRQTDQVDFPYYRSGDQKIETDPVPYGQGLSSRVIVTRQPLLINQDYARRSEELGVVRYKPEQYDISRNSWLGVPIQVGEQVIGMVCVMNLERENAFTESDVRLLTTIAANVGIAIQNAQLYMTVQQELAERKRAEEKIRQSADQLVMLNEIGRAVAEVTDLKTVLEIIRQQLEKLVEFDFYSVRIFNEIERTVTYLAVYENGRYWDEPEAALEPGTHACRIFETGESILHLMTEEELEKYRRGLYTLIGDHSKTTTSLIFVPLKKLGKTIGTLSLQRYEPNSYTPEHLHLVEAVAIQVAIAIENARLFESLQRELQERTRAEEIREKLIGELEHKNAELERFTYTVSHDLRSPLVTIKGFVGMLDKDLQDHRPDRVQSDLHRIAGAADKMDALLSDLLELSRIGRIVNPPEEVDTVKLIQDALDSVNAQLRAKNVTVNILPGLPKLHGDRIRLREVFENLIGNAAKYMGDQTDPLIEIGFREQEDEKVYYVRDNGMGIDPQYHTRIFNLFEKLNPAIEGTGVGLAIVKRIIEVHGGRVWAESDGLGKGSTFSFTIPAAGNETRLN